jgi:hypothetical protein
VPFPKSLPSRLPCGHPLKNNDWASGASRKQSFRPEWARLDPRKTQLAPLLARGTSRVSGGKTTNDQLLSKRD